MISNSNNNVCQIQFKKLFKEKSMSNLKKQFFLCIFILIIKQTVGSLQVTNTNNNANSFMLSINMTNRLKFVFTNSKIFDSCASMSAVIYSQRYSEFTGVCKSSSPFYDCQIKNNSITLKQIYCQSQSIQDGLSIEIQVDYVPNKVRYSTVFVAYSTVSSSYYQISNTLNLPDFSSCEVNSLDPQCKDSSDCKQSQFYFLRLRANFCLSCPPSCRKCSKQNDKPIQCSQCQIDYYLSQNSTCNKMIACSQNYYRKNNEQCELCSKSCKTCEYVNYNCTTCEKGSYLAINYTADTYKINQLCIQQDISYSSIFTPLPFLMSFGALTLITLFSKFIFKQTIFKNVICSISGSIESISWIFYASYIVLSFEMDQILLNPTIYLFIGAIGINTIFNFISIYLFLKYIFGDKTFKNQLVSIGQKFSFFPYYFTITCSIFFSHKIIQLLFSKLFKIPSLSFKISTLDKLIPLTYIRYFSLVPSSLAIAAAVFGKISFDTETKFSLLTWDLIALTSISLISTIFTAQRSLSDYEAKTCNANADPNENLNDQLYIMKTSKRGQRGQIRFSDIKRDYLDEPSNRRRQRLQKQTTEGNLILSSEANSQECYYNQIHVNAFEKDQINSLRDTRLTQLNMQKRPSQEDRSSNRSDSVDFEEFHNTPYNRNTRRIKGIYNKRRANRSSRSLYSQEGNVILSQKIESLLSYQQIHKLKILQNIQQIWQQIPQNFKLNINQLYNNSYRMTRSQIITSITKITEAQLKKLNEHTQLSIKQVQFSLVLLDESNITINQFFDYLNNLNRASNKENNTNINSIEVDKENKYSSKSQRYRTNSNEAKQNRGRGRYPMENSRSQSRYSVQSQGNQQEEISQFAIGQKFSQTHLRKVQTSISQSIKTGYRSPSRSNQPQPICQVDKQLETDKKAVGSMLSVEKKQNKITVSMDGIQKNLAQKFNSNVSKSTESVRADVKKGIKTKIAESIIFEDNHRQIIEIEEDQFTNGVSVADVIQRYTNTQNDLMQKVPDENQRSYALPPRKSHRRRSNRYAS